MKGFSDQQLRLLEFVKEQHGDQKRKYTGVPYWHHLVAVAQTMIEHEPAGVEIALCHDLFEDTPCKRESLYAVLKQLDYPPSSIEVIIGCVEELTDQFTHQNYPDLNRKERKKLEAQRLSKISPLAQTVKYGDLIDNSRSLSDEDPSFATVYLAEKKNILKVMRAGKPALLALCESVVQNA